MSDPEKEPISPKEKALIGVGMSVASGCRPCTQRYVKAAREAGACERGIRLAIETALAARDSATLSISRWSESLQNGVPPLDEVFRAERERIVELVASGAALVQRSVEDLEQHVSAARQRGASERQITAALAIGRAVSARASAEVEAAVRGQHLAAGDSETSPCCSDGPSPARPGAPGQSGCGCGSSPQDR